MSVNTWHPWAAGVLDIGGTITIIWPKTKKAQCGHVCVTVTDANREVLEALQSIFKGTIALCTSPTRQAHWSELWRWTLASTKATDALRIIRPYTVRVATQNRIDLALEFQASKRLGFKKDDTYRKQQRAYYERFKALNVRPPRVGGGTDQEQIIGAGEVREVEP